LFICIDDEFKKFLNIVYKTAKAFNKRLFIVGGAVRDYYLNNEVKDFDIILEGNAIELASKFPDSIQIKSVHKDFGTLKLIYNYKTYDLASTRIESYPNSGCLPVVDLLGVSIEDDVKRRDFTINAMYFEILDGLEFKLIDPLNGLGDIKLKELKVLHDKSYIDDPTRIFRGVGFKHRFNFDFSAHDKKLIQSYLKNIDYSNMSKDRAYSVFKLTLNSEFCFEILDDIIKNGYYKVLTDKKIDFNLNLLKEIYNIFSFNPKDLADLSEKIISDKSIEYPNFVDKLSVFKYFSSFNRTDLAYCYYKTLDNNIVWFLKNKDIKLNINGSDIIKLGIPQGKIVGEILDKILSFKLDNPEKKLSKQDEINLAKTLFPIN